MDSAKVEELALLGAITVHLIITLLILTYLSVGLRIWARYRVTKSPGWDDAAMIATLMLFTVYCALILAMNFRVKSVKLWSQTSIRTTLILVQLSEVFYLLTTTFLKVSLGLFFLRVLTKKWQKHVFHTVLTIGVLYGFFYFFIVLFQCGDPRRIADGFIQKTSDKCLPQALRMSTGYIYGIINVLADWTFVLIPISVLMDSDLDRRSKMSVGIVMALGAVGSVSSIMRLVYLDGLDMSTMESLNAQAVKATIWATAEPGTGIIAASIAILRPLFRQIFNDVRKSASSISNPRKVKPSDDEIALRGPETVMPNVDSKPLNVETKRMSMDSTHSEDVQSPWSPIIVSTAGVPHMIIVKGKTTPASWPKAG
ncbi:hypothetical protein GGP41_006014 [Bipolaris sorokiniana]|uniref:Rhodopsin domain-containing protein n=2 Tax=Cochliobolus sativus TaxID=45130 RepID=A0A8H5ZJ52_COCSA|nr:uncharacterized protein COCSADRAFT_194497 [Bipolaris sorokiniana ND90Pr]EMD58555.1 hypothetical protein COCSADRAFT_194497 [Bipolaris sorokiniana ND90Pr]KAF5849065.1 hypothetical protein GGP41_006014 [Bipolaris sorokiniana]